jgi:hypothetical protein
LQKLRDVPQRNPPKLGPTTVAIISTAASGNLEISSQSFPSSAITRFLGADTVAGPFLTSNEFSQKKRAGDEKKGKWPHTKKNEKPESRT